MRVALAQFTASTDPAENLALVRTQIEAAADATAELVVFPEAMSCSFARPRIEAAEPLDGPWASGVRQAAADAGVTVIVGLFTPGTAGRARNTLLVTGPSVEEHYEKLHLFDAYGYRESEQVEAGNRLVTVPVGGVTVGLATCYDIRFPDQFIALARAGAEVIVVPSSWAPGARKLEQWRALAIARALDSTSIVVAVDQAQPSDEAMQAAGPRRPTGIGHSMVVGPLGEVLLELDTGPQLAALDVDVSTVAQAREHLPVLANARFVSRLGE